MSFSGMDEIGIYRLSGVASEIQQLKKMFNVGKYSFDLRLNFVKKMPKNGLNSFLKFYFHSTLKIIKFRLILINYFCK